MNMIINILLILIAGAVGAAFGYYFLHQTGFFNAEKRKEHAEARLEEARKEAEAVRERAKAVVKEIEDDVEEGAKMNQKMVERLETSLKNKEEALKRREEKVGALKVIAAEIEEEISAKKGRIKNIELEYAEELTKKSGKTKEALKEEIINKYEADLREENEESLARTEEYTKEKAQRIAKKIIVDAIQRLGAPTSVEAKSVQIEVQKDIVKGKLVGKDAKNILYLESLVNMDVIFNDFPNTISISSFNLMERRIGEKTLEKLINERGEIDQKVIDTAFKRAKEEIKDELYEIGRNALIKMGIRTLPSQDKELVQTIGRLKFRTSYSQNIMMHSMEVGYIATMLGAELGLDVEVCKVAGFLHDLGKAIDQDPDVQGAHDFLTKELMEKYGFSKEAVHAAWTHHESEKPATPEALIVQAADALSASRPGARAESLEKYLERLFALESTASSFDGVRKAFAISAGREVRVIVDPIEVSDEQTQDLANNIAKKIEADLAYPGKIRVNVIRKTKTTELAR